MQPGWVGLGWEEIPGIIWKIVTLHIKAVGEERGRGMRRNGGEKRKRRGEKVFISSSGPWAKKKLSVSGESEIH